VANWSNPTLTSLYTDFVNEVKNRDVDLALGLDPATTSPTNIPTNAIRWNSANKRWEKYDGSTWNALSTAFSVPMGAQGTPSIYFGTTADAGLYSPGAGQVAISTGGTGRVFVDSAGNVGIGIASPGALLHAAGTIRYGSNVNYYGEISHDAASTGANIYNHSDSGGHIFQKGGVNQLVIDASGNLGLGVMPSAWSGYKPLQAGSGASFGGYAGDVLSFMGSNAYNDNTNWRYILGGNAAARYQQSAGVHTWHTALSGTAGDPITFTQAMTLDASGRLLVGTTSVVEKQTLNGCLAITGASATSYYIGNNNGAFIDYASGQTRIGAQTSGSSGTSIGFFTATSAYTTIAERASISNLGYLTGTVNGLSSGIYPSKQYFRLNADRTGTNVTTAQSVFGVGATLIGSTQYEFECLMILKAAPISNATVVSFNFGGTATINNIIFMGTGPGRTNKPVFGGFDAAPTSFYYAAAAGGEITASIGIGDICDVAYLIKGTVSINASGTFIPNYQFSVAPGAAWVTAAGSYFNIWPLGASGSNISIGSWA